MLIANLWFCEAVRNVYSMYEGIWLKANRLIHNQIHTTNLNVAYLNYEVDPLRTGSNFIEKVILM